MDDERPELTVTDKDAGLMYGKEVDAFLKIGATTRYKLAKIGALEVVKIGRATRFTRRSVRRIAAGGAP